MNKGILDINPSVEENYLDVLNGKVILSNKAVEIRSEIITTGIDSTIFCPTRKAKRFPFGKVVFCEIFYPTRRG